MSKIMSEAKQEDFSWPQITVFNLDKKKFARNHQYEQIPQDEIWKIELIRDLINLKREATLYRRIDFENPGELTLVEINQALTELCSQWSLLTFKAHDSTLSQHRLIVLTVSHLSSNESRPSYWLRDSLVFPALSLGNRTLPDKQFHENTGYTPGGILYSSNTTN